MSAGEAPSVRERVTAAMASVAPVAFWRSVAAFGVALLSVLVTVGGIFSYAAPLQIGVLAALCACLVAPSRTWAALTAAAAAFLGMALGPLSVLELAPTPTARLTAAAIAAAVAAVAALAAKNLLCASPRCEKWLTWVVIALIVANMWVTTIGEAGMARLDGAGNTTPSLFQLLDGSRVLGRNGESVGDQYAYLRVLKAVKRGEDFYQAWHDYLGPRRMPGSSAGRSVFNYHMPTPFYLWAVLPGTSVSVVYAFLVLVSMAVLAVPFVVRGTVRLPLAVPGAAAVASYLFLYGGWLVVFSAEVWAGALAVLSVAAWVRSASSSKWRYWTLAAVALGVLSALFREPAVLVPLAGLAAALVVRDEQRTFRASTWALGLVVFTTLYAGHALRARPFLSGPAAGAVLRLTGLDTIVSALTNNTQTLGASGALPLALAAIGIAGIVMMRDRRSALFPGVLVVSSMVAYLFVNNAAHDATTGAAVNYWGRAIVPVLYACVPAAFAILPGMSPGRSHDGDAGS